MEGLAASKQWCVSWSLWEESLACSVFAPVLPLDFSGSGSSCYFECTHDQLISSCVLICSQNKSRFFCSSPKCTSDIILLGKCCFLVQPAVCPGLKLGSSSVHSVYLLHRTPALHIYLAEKQGFLMCVLADKGRLVASLDLEPSLHWKLLFCRQLFPATDLGTTYLQGTIYKSSLLWALA